MRSEISKPYFPLFWKKQTNLVSSVFFQETPLKKTAYNYLGK